jgi:hypothetical protein
VLGVYVSLAMVLAIVASAQAAYDDAISINLSVGSDSTVPAGPLVGAAGFSASNWMNMTGGHPANWAASVDGSGWTSGSLSGPQLTSTGAALGTGHNTPPQAGDAFRIDLYDGGWGQNSQWNTGNPLTANLPGHSGMSNGDMPHGWGPTGLGISVSTLPASFVAAGYDIWALMGPTRNSGVGLTWQKLNAAPLTTLSSPAYAIYYPATGAPYTASRSLAAVQVLKVGSAAAPDMTTDTTPGALDLGGGNLIAVGTAASKTITLTALNGNVTVTPNMSEGIFSFATPLPGQPVVPATPAAYTIQMAAQTVPGHYTATATFTTDIVEGAGFKTFTYNLSADVAAHPGDVDGSGQVGLSDYNIIKVNFGLTEINGHAVGWADGDVDASGQVGLSDYNVVKLHYGHTTGDGIGAVTTPEPATMSLLVLGGLSALLRRRRIA